MSSTGRDDALLAALLLDGPLTVKDLSNRFGVSTASIRRDLRRLAGDGHLIRTYGGAAASTSQAPTPYGGAISAKRAIAEAAGSLVADGQTIVISSGSTTLEFARRLVGRHLSVITNALDVAQVLVDQPGIDLIVLGGAVRPHMHSLLGHLTDLVAQELRADVLFMGISAISLEHGLLNDHLPEIVTDRALRQIVAQVIVLADSAKFERMAPAVVFGFDAVDTIVTDEGVSADTVAALRRLGVDVVIARLS